MFGGKKARKVITKAVNWQALIERTLNQKSANFVFLTLELATATGHCYYDYSVATRRLRCKSVWLKWASFIVFVHCACRSRRGPFPNWPSRGRFSLSRAWSSWHSSVIHDHGNCNTAPVTAKSRRRKPRSCVSEWVQVKGASCNYTKQRRKKKRDDYVLSAAASLFNAANAMQCNAMFFLSLCVCVCSRLSF